MKRKDDIWKLAAIFPALVIFIGLLTGWTGCSHKELVYPGDSPRGVDIRFGWDAAPDAKVGGMTIWFFPLENRGKVWRFDIPGMEGGKVELPVGKYRMVALNNDLSGVYYSGTTSWESLSATAKESQTGEGLLPSGIIYGGVVDDLEVTICGVRYLSPEGGCKECPVGVVRCYPDTLSTLYDIRSGSIRGLHGGEQVSGKLAGVGREMMIVGERITGGTGDVGFSLTLSGKEDVRGWGSVTALGIPEGGETRVGLRVARPGGVTLYKEVDVTAQVDSQRGRHHVYLNLGDVEIPETPPGPGDEGDVGIIAGVDGWEVIEIELGN